MATTYDPVTGLPKSRTSGLGGYAGYSLLNPQPLPPEFNGSGSTESTRTFTPTTIGNANTPTSYAGTPGGVAATIAYGGFTPDYQSLIENDPGYLGLKNSLSAQGIANAAQLAAARQRAITQFGIVPDLSGADLHLVGSDLAGDITPAVKALAQQNTAAGLSTEARIDQQYQQQVRDLKNALAAKGTLHSGEAGYQLQQAQQGYNQAQYDATQKLLDYLAGVQAAYTQTQQQAAQQLAAEAGNAAARQAGLEQNQPRQSTTATFGGYGADGRPYYVAPDGTRHNPDGSVYYDQGARQQQPAPPPAQAFNGSGSIESSRPYVPTTIDAAGTPGGRVRAF